jgi:glucosamine--fructose-6-phosphate aminotransferase (isomerizing)
MVGEYLLRGIRPHPRRGRVRQRVPLPQRRSCEPEHGLSILVISQSGETADTLAAMREAQGLADPRHHNVVGSTIARESDSGVYIHAGTEIGVASTKAFTSQVTAWA